jgi:undecaprenyl-phosphate 4-deoxy-4-formamido-L-arabinose transferase
LNVDPAERASPRPKPRISAVVPVYDGQETVGDLVARLERVLETHAAAYEILLVNDGSPDRSWDVIRRLSAERSTVRGIDLMRNFGQHNALLCGIRSAQYDLVVTLDDDLQNPPEEIPKLLAKLDEGHDVVYGDPEKRQGGRLRNVASELIRLILRSAMRADVARHVGPFRAFRTQLRDGFAGYRSPFVSIDVLLTWSTTRFAHVRVRQDPRTVGVSNYSFAKLLSHAIDMLTGFTTWPLQFASLIGFGLTLFGVGIFAWVVGRYLVLGYSVPGFPFLASIIAIFGGAQLFALGIIGEYLARIHFRSMGRPDSVVRETVGFPPTSEPGA